MKRLISAVMICICLLSFTSACRPSAEKKEEKAETTATAEPIQTATTESAEPTPIANFNPSVNLIGMLVPEDSGELMNAAKHGFLRTAENLQYPSKLYVVNASNPAASVVDKAIADGAKGLIVWANTPDMIEAAQKAKAVGIKVIVPYFDLPNMFDANLAADPNDFGNETARIMCEQIVLVRKKKAGVIVITGAAQEKEIADAFTALVGKEYPQFTITDYTGVGVEADVREYVKAHADLVGVLALQSGSAKIWDDACVAIQRELKPTPKPSATTGATGAAQTQTSAKPTPTPTIAPTNTPVASSPVQSAANEESYKRGAVIIALDYTKENLTLVKNRNIFAVIARPFYDSTAQSVALMDRLLRIIPTPVDVRLNVPIVRENGISKYLTIQKEIARWFAQ